MEYVLVLVMFLFCNLLAFYIIKCRYSFLKKMLVNAVCLIVGGIAVYVTGIGETSLLIYILIMILTFLGIIARILTPVVLNMIEKVFSSLTKQTYSKLSYDEEMASGNKMFFCVMTYTALKITLYVTLAFSCLGIV